MKLKGKTTIRKIRGTIALRVFWVIFILILMPLFIFYILEYHREYHTKKADFFKTLQILGESRKDSIVAHMKRQIYYFLRLAPTQPLPEIQRIFDFVEASKLTKQNNRLICTDSSNPDNIGKDYSEFLPAFAHHRYHIIYGPYLYLTQVLSDDTLLIGSNNLSEFLGTVDAMYPIDMSLFSKGKIFISSNASYIGTKIHLTPAKGISDGYVFNGQNMAAVIPMKDLGISLLVDIEEEYIKSLHWQYYFLRLLKMFLFITIIGGGSAWILIRKLSAPLKNLLNVMDRVKEGDVSQCYVPAVMGYEINMLGTSFNEMIQSVLKHQKIAEQERVAKEKLAQELKIGHDIQMSLFPSAMPHIKGLDITSGYVPAKEVGGDFYDIFYYNDRVYFIIADVCGKGISACLYALGVRSLFRSFFILGKPISEVVSHVNEVFFRDVEASLTFVTAWVGELHLDTKELTYCSLGHFPALLRQKGGEIQELQTDGIAIGVSESIEVFEKKITLQREDILLLYTDGIIEAHDRDHHGYGIEKLKTFLQKIVQLPSKEMVSLLLQDVKAFSVLEEQADDMTAVIIRLL
ncbi:MAG: SpoIIE family protein phosphatase [Parachlamydiales bacterium]|nr:SpoIIE family protein phosphatase [Parachlamydiales bacterium]